ncbi:hypothetical protein ACJW30_10G074900 [Castanea mollissima]
MALLRFLPFLTNVTPSLSPTSPSSTHSSFTNTTLLSSIFTTTDSLSVSTSPETKCRFSSLSPSPSKPEPVSFISFSTVFLGETLTFTSLKSTIFIGETLSFP